MPNNINNNNNSSQQALNPQEKNPSITVSGEVIKQDKIAEIMNKNNKSKQGQLKLNLKEEIFCKKYIEEGFNGTKAYLAVKPNIKRNSASVRAVELLKKDSVKARIVKLLNASELEEVKVIAKAIKGKTPKNISWKEIHSFIRTSLELKGKLNKEAVKTDINIGMFVSK